MLEPARVARTGLAYLTSGLCWLVGFAVAAFAGASIYFCAEISHDLRCVLSAGAALGIIAPALFQHSWRRRLLFAAPALVLVFGWYYAIKPKQNAPWAPDVARLPEAKVQGDLLTMRHIRSFHYRTDTDFDVDYYDKVFDLNQIRSVDLFLSYWGPRDIAHTVISFGFAGGEQLAVSIETRKERGEEYSAVQGFFKKFELIYVVADERDVIGVRVNQRKEDVYLYRLRLGPTEARDMLLDYVKSINKLEHKAKFYNALTTNCTTSIVQHIREFHWRNFNWALIANGHIDHWRYNQGVWGFDLPFEEFRRRSQINDKVRAARDAADFSQRIREGLPSIAAIEKERARGLHREG